MQYLINNSSDLGFGSMVISYFNKDQPAVVVIAKHHHEKLPISLSSLASTDGNFSNDDAVDKAVFSAVPAVNISGLTRFKVQPRDLMRGRRLTALAASDLPGHLLLFEKIGYALPFKVPRGQQFATYIVNLATSEVHPHPFDMFGSCIAIPRWSLELMVSKDLAGASYETLLTVEVPEKASLPAI